MLPGGSLIVCMIWDMSPALDLYCTGPAQHLEREVGIKMIQIVVYLSGV